MNKGDIVDVFLGTGLIMLRKGKFIKPVEYVTIKPTEFVIDLDLKKKFLNKEIQDKVHAWVRGEIVDFGDHKNIGDEINYNPYLHDFFFLNKNKEEYYKTDKLLNFKYTSMKGYVLV